jgi:hypothetical protein
MAKKLRYPVENKYPKSEKSRYDDGDRIAMAAPENNLLFSFAT